MTARQPPEWARHDWVWIGFPSHGELWLDDLEPAREEVIAFAKTVHAGGAGEEVRLVAADVESADAARRSAGHFATIVQQPVGDIWLRDTGPLIVSDGTQHGAACSRFNGGGGKFELEGDDSIGPALADTVDFPVQRHDWILEG